jgi:hypothetical protein
MLSRPELFPGSLGYDVVPITGTVFFVWSAKDLERFASNPTFLDSIDVVISILPGVSLHALNGTIPYMTLEQALDTFDITQRAISLRESDYCQALMDREIMEIVLQKFQSASNEAIRVALLNHIGLLVHNIFALELLFHALVRNGLHTARFFRSHGSFRLIERPEIRTLLQLELGFGPQLAYLCDEVGVKKEQVGCVDRFALFKNRLRDLLLLGYKWKTLSIRSWLTRQPHSTSHVDAVFVTRARTEVNSAEPILRHRAERGCRDIMLVDDLIKSPDGTAAASLGSRDWHPLHGYSTPREVTRIFFRCMWRRHGAAQIGMALQPERVARWGFLGREEIASQVLYTAFASIPELLVHHLQLCRAFTMLTPSALVSFDTVDRWGALQGELARRYSLNSVMIQNTAADDIYYPWPLAMDHLVLGNERLRQIFIASGADPARVHAFGLPIQDDVLETGNARLNESIHGVLKVDSPLRLLIATQPFAEEFDYNAALIHSLETAISDLVFPVVWIFKPHPRESFRKYEVIRAELESRSHRTALYNGPFEEALMEADIVVSRTSTSLEFAALGGVPGIAHLHEYPRDILDRLDYLRSPVTHKTFSTAELSKCLQAYAPQTRSDSLKLYESRRNEFIGEFCPGQGGATIMVANLISSGCSKC